MKSIILVSLLLVFVGCSSAPAPAPTTAAKTDEKPIAFFTDVHGPSKETGDCGGYAFWLYEKDGQYYSGEAAEFEGGCGIYEKQMIEVQHNSQTGKLEFLAPSADTTQLLKFEGKVTNDKLEGVVTHVNKTTKKSVSPKAPKSSRTFARVDFKTFEQSLPQVKK